MKLVSGSFSTNMIISLRPIQYSKICLMNKLLHLILSKIIENLAQNVQAFNLRLSARSIELTRLKI